MATHESIRGWWSLQAFLVDAIKRRAIARLQRTAAGEALLLRIYLWAEEGVEAGGLAELRRAPAPDWLGGQLRRHLADESRHAARLRQRLRALGDEAAGPARVDPLSRLKLGWLRRLEARAARSFRAGPCVPLLAIAFRMEAMGVRVLNRHIEVLRAHPDAGASTTLTLLEEILVDERAHVAACGGALERLIDAAERPALEALIRRIDAVDRAFGVTGALVLLALSLVPRRPRALVPAGGAVAADGAGTGQVSR